MSVSSRVKNKLASAAKKKATENLFKITVVGDGGTGKTCMLFALCRNVFWDDHALSVFDNFQHDIEVDGKVCTLDLWDTAGQEDLVNLRKLAYPLTHVFILTFATNLRSSFANVDNVWRAELEKAREKEVESGNPGDAKVLLVGTKIDLRPSESLPEYQHGVPYWTDDAYVYRDEGRSLQKRIDACHYMECSSKTREGIQEVFKEAARIAMGKRGNPCRVS